MEIRKSIIGLWFQCIAIELIIAGMGCFLKNYVSESKHKGELDLPRSTDKGVKSALIVDKQSSMKL